MSESQIPAPSAPKPAHFITSFIMGIASGWLTIYGPFIFIATILNVLAPGTDLRNDPESWWVLIVVLSLFFIFAWIGVVSTFYYFVIEQYPKASTARMLLWKVFLISAALIIAILSVLSWR